MMEKQGCRRSGNVGEPVMQECGWAGEPVMQEEWIAAAAGGGYTSNCKSGRGAYGAGKEKVWKIR
jgi:hypothetical protein